MEIKERKERIVSLTNKFNLKETGSKLATYVIDNHNQIVGAVNHLLVGDEMAQVIYGISKLLENDEWVTVVHSFSASCDYFGKVAEQRARERQQDNSLYIITPRLIFAANRRHDTAVSDARCLKEGVNVQLIREEEMGLQFCAVLFNFREEVERARQEMEKNKGHWVYNQWMYDRMLFYPGPQYMHPAFAS